jgi:uncharacterized protein YggE
VKGETAMRNLIAVSVVMLVMVSSAFAEPEPRGTPSELTAYLRGLQRSIILTEITGESKIEAQADKAIVEISIKTENASLEACLKSNQEMRENIISELIEAGISAEETNAENFSSTPGYRSLTDKPGKYKAQTIVKITVTDKDKLPEIAKIVDTHSEVEYLGINFEHSKEKELQKQAINQAIDDMMKKKTEYEKKFNATLALRSFSEHSTIPQASQTCNSDMKASFRNTSLQGSETSKSEVPIDKSPPPFGELVFTANVSGEFELR